MDDKKIYIKMDLIALGPNATGSIPGRVSGQGYKASFGEMSFEGRDKQECLTKVIHFFRGKRGDQKWEEHYELPLKAGFAEDEDYLLPESVLDQEVDAPIDWDLLKKSNL